MTKKIIFLFILCFMNLSCFAGKEVCGQAASIDSPFFCQSFKTVAGCHCRNAPLPATACMDMNYIYRLMVGLYGRIEDACLHQKDTKTETCIDDWYCYRTGRTAQGALCNAFGAKCA